MDFHRCNKIELRVELVVFKIFCLTGAIGGFCSASGKYSNFMLQMILTTQMEGKKFMSLSFRVKLCRLVVPIYYDNPKHDRSRGREEEL